MKLFKSHPTETYDNLRQLYLDSVDRYADRVLIKQRINDSYEEITYRRYGADVEALGTALLARSLGGKHVILIGENSYHWLVSYLAVICGVGVVIPVDKDISAEALKSIADTAEAAAIIHSPTCTEAVSACGNAILTISFDALDDMIREGNERIIAGDRAYLDTPIDNDTMSTIIFTSGTDSSIRKGIMLSHRNLCFSLS